MSESVLRANTAAPCILSIQGDRGREIPDSIGMMELGEQTSHQAASVLGDARYLIDEIAWRHKVRREIATYASEQLAKAMNNQMSEAS